MAEMICPKCGAAIEIEEGKRFVKCPGCGKSVAARAKRDPIKAPSKPKRGAVAFRHAKTSAKGAQTPLLVAAILTTLLLLVMLVSIGAQSGGMRGEEMAIVLLVVMFLQDGVSAVFWVLYIVARVVGPHAAFIPAILGLVFYTLLALFSVLLMIIAPIFVCVLPIHVGVIVMLISGIRSSLTYRRMMEQREAGGRGEDIDEVFD